MSYKNVEIINNTQWKSTEFFYWTFISMIYLKDVKNRKINYKIINWIILVIKANQWLGQGFIRRKDQTANSKNITKNERMSMKSS